MTTPDPSPVPKKLNVYYKSAQEVRRGWDEGEDDAPIRVHPAFAVQADNPKTNETAQRWAEGYGHEKEVRMFTTDNTPIEGLMLVSLEHRREGGRAWKVSAVMHPDAPPGYFDLREDALLEALLTVGCVEGKVGGKWVWAKNGSLRLTRVDSPAYKAMLARAEVRKAKPMKVKGLTPGHVYVSKGDEAYVYLGRVDAERIEEESGRNYTRTEKRADRRNAYGYVQFHDYTPDDNEDEDAEELPKDAEALADMRKGLSSALLGTRDRCYVRLDFTAGPKPFVREIGSILDLLPEGTTLFDAVRQNGGASALHQFGEYDKHNAQYAAHNSGHRYGEEHRRAAVRNEAPELTVRPAGTPLRPLTEYPEAIRPYLLTLGLAVPPETPTEATASP